MADFVGIRILLASRTTYQGWAYTVCAYLNDLCNYQTTLEVVAILSFGLMVVTWGY